MKTVRPIHFIVPLVDWARRCAISTDNPDTCGVCGKHFEECEVERVFHPGDGEEWAANPVTEHYACDGANLRAKLVSMRDEATLEYVRMS